MARRRQREQAWKECLVRPWEGDDTGPPRLALQRLRERSADERDDQFLDCLLRWHELTPRERQQLLLQIDAHVRKHEMRERATELVMVLAQNAPDGAGCGSAIAVSVIGVMVLSLSTVVSDRLGISPDGQGALLCCVMVVMGVLGVVAFERSRRATYRRFFTDKFIEPLAASGVDVGLVLKALDHLQKMQGLSSTVRAMLTSRPALIKLLRTRGMIPSEDQAGDGA